MGMVRDHLIVVPAHQEMDHVPRIVPFKRFEDRRNRYQTPDPAEGYDEYLLGLHSEP